MPEEFNWVSFVDTLAGGDICKYEKIYELKYEECLFKLLYEHHRDKYMNEVNRRQELMLKNKR